MNAKYLLAILAAIICTFAVIGNNALDRATETFGNAAIQSRAATQQIGMCFDWYGLTLINTTVQYAHGIVDSKTAIQKLKEGHTQNNVLLQNYFQTSLDEEAQLSQYVLTQNAEIDKILSTLYTNIESENRDEVEKLIPVVYEATSPMCDTINNIIEIKTENSIEKVNLAMKSIRDAQTILILMFALFIALSAGIFMPDLD